MDASYNLKALQYRGDKTLIFGGFFDEKSQRNSFMVILNKEGECEKKLEYAPLMQGQYPCVIRNDALYSVSRKNMQEVIKKFDGNRWITEYE